MYAIARDCRWTISGFHWCPIYCTFHLCFAQTRDAGSIAIAIGAHAPMLALSASSKVNDELRYVDDASFGSAAAAYESSMPVLPAAELRADLSEADRAWLVGLSAEMKYNLNYWRPQNVGDVIFNTWD